MASTNDNVIIASQEILTVRKDNCEATSGETSKEDTSDTETRELFYKELMQYEDQLNASKMKTWTQESIKEIIKILKNAKATTKKVKMYDYWIQIYDIVTTGSGEYLTFKKKQPSDPTVRIVPRELYFDILSRVHKFCDHGGQGKILRSIKSKYYIPKKVIEIFVSKCPVCKMKKSQMEYLNLPPTIMTSHLKGNGFLGLIDLRSSPDGKYNWLLNYRNLSNKFTILRPLKTNSVRDVAYELFTIFLTIGTHQTLISDLAPDYLENVLQEFAEMWADCKITHKIPIHDQNNNTEVENMLRSWMNKSNCTNWSVGCFFVQYKMNTSYYDSAVKTSYEFQFKLPIFASKLTITPACTLVSIENTEQPLSVSEQKNTNTMIKNNFGYNSPDCINPETMSDSKVSEAPLNVETNKTESSSVEQNNTPTTSERYNPYDFKCNSCGGTIHVICGITEIDHGQMWRVSCYVCKNEQDMELPENKGLKRLAEDNLDSPNKIPNLAQEHSELASVPEGTESQGTLDETTIKTENDDEEQSNTITTTEKCNLNAYKCKSCGGTVHVICGISENSQGQVWRVSCYTCKSEQDMTLQQNKVLKRPSEYTLDITKKVSTLAMGHSILASVPKNFQGPTKLTRIRGKIVDIRNGVYRVATRTGMIKNWFEAKDLEYDETDYGLIIQKPVTLEAVMASQAAGDKLVNCLCKPFLRQCTNCNCLCFKNKVMCGPLCHKGLVCANG